MGMCVILERLCPPPPCAKDAANISSTFILLFARPQPQKNLQDGSGRLVQSRLIVQAPIVILSGGPHPQAFNLEAH